MKSIFKIFLKYYLKLITKFVLSIHRPTIIVVAGSINKHFVTQEIKKELLRRGLDTRANPKNFNTEIGLPLAVLNLGSGYNSYYNWLPVIFEAFKKLFTISFPEYLVLSLGSSDPGDMKYLLSIVKPDIAVITDVTQRYREGFGDLEALLKEYAYLVGKLYKEDILIINNDNPHLNNLKNNTQAKVITLGQKEKSDYCIKIIENTKNGQRVEINNNKFLIERFGYHHVYAKAVADIVLENVIDSKN